MRNRVLTAAALATTMFLASAGGAFAYIWVLVAQLAPYSTTPPPYSEWQPFQQFGTQNHCIDSRMTLHYQYWSTNQDLSMRALAGGCPNESTGRIAMDYDITAPDDDF